MANFDLSAYHNEDFSVTLTIKDDSGDIIDLTGYTITSSIKNRYSDSSSLVSFNTNISNPSRGLITVALSAIQIGSLPIGQLLYEISSSSSGTHNTLLRGNLNIYPSILG